jgi:hypothetical protein
MTIGQIHASIAAYLRKPISEFVIGSGATSTDLIYLALNNARKAAEKARDFSICRKRGYFSITTNANWTAPTWFDASSVTARKVKNWYVRVTGTGASGEFGGIDRAVKAVTLDQLSLLYRRNDYSVAPMTANQRYASDVDTSFGLDPLLGQTYIVIDGQRCQMYPVPTSAQVIVIDAYFWYPDWTVGTTDDWWTQHGAEYLLYKGMVEANRLNQMFAGNVEGNLPPPVREAQTALEELIKLDIDSSESSAEISDL